MTFRVQKYSYHRAYAVSFWHWAGLLHHTGVNLGRMVDALSLYNMGGEL